MTKLMNHDRNEFGIVDVVEINANLAEVWQSCIRPKGERAGVR